MGAGEEDGKEEEKKVHGKVRGVIDGSCGEQQNVQKVYNFLIDG